MLFDVDTGVCVIDLGYMGLPTAALIARSGGRALGFDFSAQDLPVLEGA